MNKQITINDNQIFAVGKNSDFPILSESKAVVLRWDSRLDRHLDYLAVEQRHSGLSERHVRNILNGDI